MKKTDMQRIQSIDALRTFHEILESTRTENIFELAGPMEELVRQDFLLELMHYELACIAEQRDYVPKDGTYNFLNLVFNEKFTFSLIMKNIKQPARTKLYSNYPSDQIICPLSKEGFRYHLFERSTDDPMNRLNKEKKLEVMVEDGTLEYGRALCIDSESNVLAFCPNHEQPVIALILSGTQLRDYTWEYDGETLLPVRIVTGNNNHTRVEFTCNMLGEIGDEASIPVLFGLLDSEAHNVRWQAARSLCKLNLEEGVRALEMLKNDPHQEIRRLAASSLNKIYMTIGVQNN
jgi:hypothetical protein